MIFDIRSLSLYDYSLWDGDRKDHNAQGWRHVIQDNNRGYCLINMLDYCTEIVCGDILGLADIVVESAGDLAYLFAVIELDVLCEDILKEISLHFV